MDSLTGKLLVAAPSLEDPNFARSVIALANHDEDGALGVVLNRRTEALVAETVPDLAPVMGDDDQLHFGGPVQQEAIVVLAEFEYPDEPHLTITGTIGLVGDRAEIERLGAITGRLRAYAGYAGWAPGQLENEIEREDWFMADAMPGDIFVTAPERLWSDVLERMGGEYTLVARMPLDPSLN